MPHHGLQLFHLFQSTPCDLRHDERNLQLGQETSVFHAYQAFRDWHVHEGSARQDRCQTMTFGLHTHRKCAQVSVRINFVTCIAACPMISGSSVRKAVEHQ